MLVAEIGLNHFGSVRIASQFINELTKTDIDAITFQIAGQNFYKKNKKFKLPNSFYLSAIKKVHSSNNKIGLAFADYRDYKKYNKYDYDFFKFLSKATKQMATDTRLDLRLRHINKSIFLSIGTVTEFEISKVLKKISNKFTTLLYTSFSKKNSDLDLGVIKRLKKKFKTSMAYGQHGYSIKILLKAKSMGYNDIFFYVKRDIKRIHPDERHAIKLNNLNKIIKDLK